MTTRFRSTRGIALGTFTYYWHTVPTRRNARLTMAHNILTDAQ